MKKIFKFIFILMAFCFFNSKVYAIGLGTPTGTENYDGIISEDSEQEYSVKAGSRHTIVVTYGIFDDESDVSRIDVTINAPENIGVTLSTSHLGSGDTITGLGKNYTINIGETEDKIEGVGLFVLQFPNVTTSTELNVSATANAYNKSGSLKETKTINIKYYVLVKSTSCDDNREITISSNIGEFQKVDSWFAESYTQTTEKPTFNLKIVPSSSKTQIAYLGDSFSSDNSPQYNSSINFTNQPLNYGENNYVFSINTECVTQSDEWRQKTSWVFIIGGSDWYNDIFYNSSAVVVGINRPDTRSKVNTLKTLSISNATINFNPDLKNYFVTVPYNVSSVTINSTLTDAKSSYVAGLGNRTVNLNVGDNYIEIKVRAENGNETSYNIRVTREKNNDSSLKSIKVDSHEIIVKEKTLLYTLKVDNDVLKPTITAIASDLEAKIEIDPIEELKEGENKINIIVTAADNTKTNYVVNIIRDKLISTNSKIKKLTIKNHDILFDSETFNYKVKLDKDEEKLDINVETSNNKATYLITGNKDLMNKSVIKIKVTAEDKETISTYTIEIEKDIKNKSNYFPFIILGVGIISIILAILLKKKKKNNN